MNIEKFLQVQELSATWVLNPYGDHKLNRDIFICLIKTGLVKVLAD